MMWSSQALAAVTVQVDRYNISENETVNLSIEVSGDDSGEPQLEKLQQDFELLSRNQSTSYSLINGSMSKKAIWNIILRPKRAGALTLPPNRSLFR
ncbi:MAG: BatD family protein [Mariprofundus sp.]